jgi:hypothetical protein
MQCRWTLLQNGIDVSLSVSAPTAAARSRSARRRSTGRGHDRPARVAQGRDVLIAAAAPRAPAGRRRLLVVGDGPTAAELRGRAEALGISGSSLHRDAR